MSMFVEKTGKNVQEAIESALIELGADESQVEIEIIDEGTKGILGFLGGKAAKVRVKLQENLPATAEGFLKQILSKMNIDADIDIEENEESISLTVSGDDVGIIIGRRGETLDALQYLTSLVVNKNSENYKRVIIDTENYRQKREETLVKLANKLAERVTKYRKSITLEPMNPYERRIIHATLQNYANIKTYSIGDDPNRKVVIACK